LRSPLSPAVFAVLTAEAGALPAKYTWSGATDGFSKLVQ